MKINRKQLRKLIMESLLNEQYTSLEMFNNPNSAGWKERSGASGNFYEFSSFSPNVQLLKDGQDELLNVKAVFIFENGTILVKNNTGRSVEIPKGIALNTINPNNYTLRIDGTEVEFKTYKEIQEAKPSDISLPGRQSVNLRGTTSSRNIEIITYTGDKNSGWEYENNTDITGGNDAPGGGYFIATGRISIKKEGRTIHVSQIQVFRDGSMVYLDLDNNSAWTGVTSEDFSSYNVPSFEEIEGMRRSNERDQRQQPSQASASTQRQNNQRRSSNSKVKQIQEIIGATPDGIWGPETNEKLLEYTKAFEVGRAGPRKAVIVDPAMPGQSLWKNWKENAPKVKSIKVGTSARGQKTMTFGPDAGNPAMKGNLTDLLKVLEFIRDARAESVNESLSHGALIRRRYRRY